jgi:hypothetical protein
MFLSFIGTKTFKTFKWVVYVDSEVAPADYVPERIFGEGGCSVM